MVLDTTGCETASRTVAAGLDAKTVNERAAFVGQSAWQAFG